MCCLICLYPFASAWTCVLNAFLILSACAGAYKYRFTYRYMLINVSVLFFFLACVGCVCFKMCMMHLTHALQTGMTQRCCDVFIILSSFDKYIFVHPSFLVWNTIPVVFMVVVFCLLLTFE